MDSGSIFGGYYGFIKGGIWRITEELGTINAELGVETHLSSNLTSVEMNCRQVTFEKEGSEHKLGFDVLILGTDPLTASRLVGTEDQIKSTEAQRFRGSSGKLNLIFRNPVRWKYGSDAADSDAAFRFLFSVNSLSEFEDATLGVLDDNVPYAPGFAQVYCEGAAMRQLGHHEPFDRLAVFFKNLSLGEIGAAAARPFSIAPMQMIPQRISIDSLTSTMFTCADPAPIPAGLLLVHRGICAVSNCYADLLIE
jgi:hypothetical protein